MTILKILGAVIAFAYGLWAGFGRYRQDPEDLKRALTERGERRRATRHTTPLDIVSRMTGISTRQPRRDAFRFGGDEEDEDEEPGVERG